MMNNQHRSKQKLLLFAIFGAILMIALIISFLWLGGTKSEKKFSTKVDLPMDHTDPKEVWMDKIRSENEVVQNKVDYIQDLVVGRLREEENKEQSVQQEILTLRNEIDELRASLKNSQVQASLVKDLREELRHVSANHSQDIQEKELFSNFQSSETQEIFVPLVSLKCAESANLHHVDRCIPTGTSVKAILVSSVDMPCGVKGGSDPLPVKLRVIADGRLPKEVRAKLKGSIVTASVYGDLSSERVYFRLEKLTQVRADGHFIDTQVAGYVSGEDGKYGLRGTVVDKSNQLIENALISGFFSGASNFFETAALAKLSPCGPFACGPGGTNQPLNWKQSAGQVAIAGGGEGVTNAMDALTNYFIERAEQLRPVIQITPGRIVDITFLDSADLGDLHTHERVRNSGEQDVCRY